MSTKSILRSSAESKKTFSYELDDIKISFTFRTDIKKELKAGIAILNRAITDMEKQLEMVSEK